MAAILVYSDKSPLAAELLTAARKIAKTLGWEVKAVCINNEGQAVELSSRGAATFLINNPNINLADTAAVASALQQAAQKLAANMVILASDRRGKEVAGRLAQKLQAGCLTDVNEISVVDGKVQCCRNTLGGAVVATQQFEFEHQVIALMARAYETSSVEEGGSVTELDVEIAASPLKIIDAKSKAVDAVDIAAAKVLVIVGQGVEESDLESARRLAVLLGGEMACSKPVATDRKWFTEDRIVGLSGKICKPQLAIILGVSGQVQFTVGIRDAETIIVINNDENADILKIGDYAMVADLKTVLPELINSLA